MGKKTQKPGEAKAKAGAPETEIEALVRGWHADPFRVLGPHSDGPVDDSTLYVRVFRPRAVGVSVIWNGTGEIFPAVQIRPEGFFEATIPSRKTSPTAGAQASASYRLQIRFPGGGSVETYDAYAFPPLLSDYDLHLAGEGTHYLKYEKLGAHLRSVEGVRGVHFGVWAPNADRVSVVGDFNSWDGRVHAMRSRGTSGIWEIFLPGLEEGAIYKFEILFGGGKHMALKSDPYGFAAEQRPKTASMVCNIDRHEWKDAEWLAQRASRDWLHAPMSIYELHAGAWRRKTEEGNRWLTYRELADVLIPYVKQMGFTHIELMPIMEHPLDSSWGYQTVGYFAVTSRYGSPEDFMYFIDRCHQENLGVILDWTPAHFPRDAHGLAFFDGTHLYEHADPRLGAHPDWGTLVFNYGRNEVQNFLLSNALFWLDKYHIDGLRVDAVASMLYLDYSRKPGEWIPNRYGGRENLDAVAFIKHLNVVVHTRHPGALMIAEESTSWPAVSRPTYLGGLGFDLKWNMGWMNDTLKYFSLDPFYRKFHHNQLTFSMIYAFTENFILPFSHDEVVHGKGALLSKMPGDDGQKFANLRLLFAYMYAHPGKKLLFMGGELAQRSEFWEEGSVDWSLLDSPSHRGVQKLLEDLNHLHTSQAALHGVDFEWAGFEWIEVDDAASSVLAFMRRPRNSEEFVIVVCNFTPVLREDHRIGVPQPGFYREILNTDSEHYTGTGQGNSGGVNADPVPWNNRPHSVKLRLPPLGVVFLKPDRA